MEFMNKVNRPAPSPSPAAPGEHFSGRGKNRKLFKGLRVASIALLFSATALVVALVWYLALGGPTKESKYVDDNRMQAVFLNGGQVYFGKIRTVNDKYVRLTDIFYLRVNQQVQPEQEGRSQQAAENNISLVKLGCELHRPTNEMLINREQVVFWENLKDDDAQNTVPGAVKEYLKQFPNGQECEDTTQQNSSQESTEAEE